MVGLQTGRGKFEIKIDARHGRGGGTGLCDGVMTSRIFGHFSN